MHNTVYARAGHHPRNKWLHDYFAAQPWIDAGRDALRGLGPRALVRLATQYRAHYGASLLGAGDLGPPAGAWLSSWCCRRGADRRARSAVYPS